MPTTLCTARQSIHGGGGSTGIDAALHIIAQAANEQLARVVQLGLEYDPKPPFDSGSFLYFSDYAAASTAVTSGEAAAFFPSVFALATGETRIVFAQVEEA